MKAERDTHAGRLTMPMACGRKAPLIAGTMGPLLEIRVKS
jgi:hypothetical protein